MKIKAFVFVAGLLLISFSISAQPKASPEAEAFFQKAMSQINAGYVSWIKSTAKETYEKNLSTDDVMNKATAYGVLGNMNSADIEAIAFLVLMQASKSAQEDLKAIMAKVKSINEEKKAMRGAQDKLNEKNLDVSRILLDSINLFLKPQNSYQRVNTVRPAKLDSSRTRMLVANNKPVSKAEIDNAKDLIKNKLDSHSEMGEMESLRLQMAMDRMSKMMSTLSNLLKKISDTANSIIQNLK